MLWIITATIISYLLGSIPTAYIFGRVLKGIDIRDFGSGNVGATNALRVLGKGPGVAVLLLDIFKGTAAVVLLGAFFKAKNMNIAPETLSIMLGIACVVGHSYTVFLNFRGGKGIATSLGVLIGLSINIPALGAIVAMIILSWLLIFAATRIISFASIIAAILLPIYIAIFRQSSFLFFSSILLSVFVILRHKQNISRLLKGQEKRISFKKKTLS